MIPLAASANVRPVGGKSYTHNSEKTENTLKKLILVHGQNGKQLEVRKQTDGVTILTRTHQDTWLDHRFAVYIDWLAQQGNTKTKTVGLD